MNSISHIYQGNTTSGCKIISGPKVASEAEKTSEPENKPVIMMLQDRHYALFKDIKDK